MDCYSLTIAEKESFPLLGERIIIGRAPRNVVEQTFNTGSNNTLGRMTDTRFDLFSNGIEPSHAILTREDEAGYAIEAVASRNEILVNGEPIHSKTLLKAGDRLEVGPYEFFLALETHESLENSENENRLISCRWCGEEMEISETECPNCGDRVPASREELETNCKIPNTPEEQNEAIHIVLDENAERQRTRRASQTRKRYCANCEQWVLAAEQQVMTSIHGPITFFLFPPWFFVWFLLKLFPSYRCTNCDGITASSEAIVFRRLDGRRMVFGGFGLLVIGLTISSVSHNVQRNRKATLFREGAELMKAEQYEQAQKKFDEYLKLDPTSAGALYNRAMTHVHLGNDEQAIEDFDAALDKGFPLGDISNKANALHQRAHCLDRLGQSEAAIDGFNQSIELQPDRAEFWSCRCHFHASRGQIDRAIHDYRQLTRLEPDESKHLRQLGNILFNHERHEEALAFFTKILEAPQPQPIAFSLRAYARMSLDQHSEAISDLESYLSHSPGDFIALRELGRCHLVLDSQSKALPPLDESIKLFEEDPEVFYLRSIVHYKLGQLERALIDVNAAISLIDRSDDVYNTYLKFREVIQATKDGRQLGAPAKVL